jgi:hypothetical protein
MNTFSYPDKESGKLIGLSGRGNQIIGSWESAGAGNSILPIVYLKQKSVLRVGQGKMVECVL